jgi:hypothetical protein
MSGDVATVGTDLWAPEPDVVIEAPDGTVELWLPRPGLAAGRALTEAADEARSREVVWHRQRGRTSSYLCAEHGEGHRWDHCRHTSAAITAAEVYEKENR